jgi:apolipoprotein N-acyltransferase
MRTPVWNALWNCLVVATVVMTFYGVLCVSLGILVLKSLVSNLLALIVLYRLWSMLEGAGHAGFSPSMEEPVG